MLQLKNTIKFSWPKGETMLLLDFTASGFVIMKLQTRKKSFVIFLLLFCYAQNITNRLPCNRLILKENLVARPGIEPGTQGFSVRFSIDK